MKILFSMIYAPDKGGSGAPIYVNHLLRSLHEHSHKTGIIFSVHHCYKNPNNSFYESLPLYFDHPAIFDNQPKVISSIPFKDLNHNQIKEVVGQFYQAFKQAILKKSYQLLHIQHGMYIGYAASLVKKELGIPYVITLHVMELNFLAEFPDPLYALKAMIEADKIIALTEAQKQRLINEYSREKIILLHMRQKNQSRQNAEKDYLDIIGDKIIDSNQIVVCPLGIDTKMFNIISKVPVPTDLQRLNIPKNAPVVMYAGRLIEMKGIRFFLKSQPYFNENRGIYSIILGGGELEDYVRQNVANYPNVYYLGFKEHKEMPYYHNFVSSHHGVFSVPSSSEGLSLVYLEAMACGVRVIGCCKRDMGSLDFMQPPYAVFADFADPVALGHKIKQMLRNKKIIRKKIRQRMIRYNLKNMYQSILQVYKNVLSKT